MADTANTSHYGLSGMYRLMSAHRDAGTGIMDEGGGEDQQAEGGAGARDAGQNDLGNVDIGTPTIQKKEFSFSWHNWENSIQELPDKSITSLRLFGEGTHDRIQAFDATYLGRILRPKLAPDATLVLIVCESSGADGHVWNPPINGDRSDPRIIPPAVIDHGTLERVHHSRLAVGTRMRDTTEGDPVPTYFDDMPQLSRRKWVYSLGRLLSVELEKVFVQLYTTTSFAQGSIMPFDVKDPAGAIAERTVWRRGIRMDLPTSARG